MKTTITRILVSALALACHTATATDFLVATNGNDTGSGGTDAPFATLERAQQAARAATKPVTVTIRGGTYRLGKTLTFGPEDSGVTWRAAAGETVVLSGGRVVAGWKEVTSSGRALWQADLDVALLPKGLRDLYVNGQRRSRAHSKPMIPAGMSRNEKGQGRGIVLDDPAVAAFARPLDLQVSQQVGWRYYILSVKSVAKADGNRTEVLLKDTPEWMAPTFVGFKSSAPVVLENALELLDEPGEWYFDKTDGKLFYLPLPGEKIGDTPAVVPLLERLVESKGANDLCFEGLTFADAGWHSPAEEGWFGYDPGHIVRGKGGKGGMSFANVYATDANRLRFHRNTFTRLGGIGLHLHQVSDAQVVGNVFWDISAEGLGLGAVKDPQAAPENLTIANNLFYHTGADYRMAPALLTGKLSKAEIHHNHVRDVPYIGLLVNKIFGKPPAKYGEVSVRWNRIEDTMQNTFDGGAIYTWFDASSDGAPGVISDNYIRGVFSRDSQGLYLDNECRYWTVERNVIEGTLAYWYLIKGSHHVLRDNFTDNDRSRRPKEKLPPEKEKMRQALVEERTVLDKTANWSAYPLAKATVAQAGLEPAYRDLLARLPKTDGSNQPPLVSIGEVRSVSLLENLRLHGTIRDDGRPHGTTQFEWSKVSGPGDVTFFGLQTWMTDIAVAFSAPGDYVLRLTASDFAAENHADVMVSVTPAEKGKDLAAGLHETAYTASKADSPKEAPAKAFDGNPNSFWYPGFPGVGWLQVDLGRAVSISRVELTLRKNKDHTESRMGFELLASNDPEFKTFVTIAEHGLDPDPAPGGTWSANFSARQPYRYVRYWKRNGYDGVVPELRVYGP